MVIRLIVIERGKGMSERVKDVEAFSEGVLNEDSSILFGEGGAGTFRWKANQRHQRS